MKQDFIAQLRKNGSLVAACILCTSTAHAQSNASPTESEATGDIIVTAQKKSERLRDVPLAVSAILGDVLAERNQVRLQDYFATVPGLNISAQGNGQVNVAVRGITTGQTTNPAVGIVIDDVPFGSSSVLGYGSRIIPDLDPATLDRVEVLRGPQGTLYGASSIGGLIKFVTKDPSTAGGEGRVEGGINSVAHGAMGFSGRGSINVPLGTTLAVRASGFYRRDGGYVDNLTTGQKDVNRTDTYGGHIALLWRPVDPLTIKLAALLQNVEGDGSGDTDTDYRTQPLFGDLTQRRVPGADHYDFRSRLYSATLSYDFGAATLTSLSSLGTSDYRASVESTSRYGDLADSVSGVPGAALVNDFHTRKFSQEVRLAGEGAVLDWLVGGFYTDEKTDADQKIFALAATGANRGLLLEALFPSTFREYAGFAALTVKLGERFDIQFGGRYGSNRQVYTEIGSGPLAGDYRLDQTSKDSKFTYQVTPRLRLNPNLMIYGRLATGYRVGGPNPLSTADATSAGVPKEFGPDTTTNYELGVKGSLPDRSVSFDVSVYRIDWKNIQLALTNPTNGFFYFINGPQAKSQGVEASVTLAPAKGTSFVLNAAYNDARLTRDLPTGSGYGFAGDRLPFSGDLSASAAFDQDFTLGADTTAFLGGTVTLVDDRKGEFGANAAAPRVEYPGYATLDLRTGVKYEGWSLTAFATNLTDQRGVVGATANARRVTVTTSFGVNYIRPRTVGLSIAKTF
ncbi:hypothetical protein ASG11_12750 [Sphingomonas sp. Leaf357]|uniref:TonB-dependent receptor n=1 Tax=Sphingomonas sp. Leaf357 TaxID=1736350 RepID=UPI0006FF56D4|nr:TonB-dependent receptor [Sphingomonas sp. Leaf357]KQS05010.1 hypothetical protein ASG11_12750 [Sphingomonas sp. Leaf357]